MHGGHTGHRRGGSRTEHVFNNGNVSYRVYTSGGNPFQSMYDSENQDENEEDEEQEQETFDPLREILYRTAGQKQYEIIRPQRNLIVALLSQLMPLIFAILIFILPYIYRHF